MKHAILAALGVLLLASCHKGSPGSEIKNGYELKQNPEWATEDFKNDYTIQFPPGFTGHGMIGFEGNTFDKRNEEDSIYFFYGFCSPTFCYDFGDTLANTAQETLQGIFLYGHDTVQLSQRINFIKDKRITGIYFYNEAPFAHGKLFWKDGGVFKEALDVRYKKEDSQLVIKIIGTIARK